jgi:hypothetical protein
MTNRASRGWGRIALAASGLIVFASAAIMLPAVASLGCALGWEGGRFGGFGFLTVVLMIVWLMHLVPLVALAPAQFRLARTGGGGAQGKLVLWLSFVATCIGLVATLRVGFPLMVLPQCL